MKKSILFVALFLVAASAAPGAVVFTDLGTAAPPATLGSYSVTPYSQAPQAEIANFTDVSFIPGGPGSTWLSTLANKRTIGSGWATWSHGYTGVVYATGQTVTLSLPPGTPAFYLYAEPNQFAILTITASTDSGSTSGPISVNGSSGANGFGFHTTEGESIVSVTVTTDDTAMAIGELGAATGGVVAIPAVSAYGLAAFALAIVAAGLFLLRGRMLG